MKPIRVHPSNTAAIEAALLAVNGKAAAHAYTTYYEIDRLVNWADRRLYDLGLTLRERVGAKYYSLSGGSVANSYRHTRWGTAVLLVRRPTGWFLTEVRGQILYKEGGHATVYLTPEQDATAVRKLRTNYIIKE